MIAVSTIAWPREADAVVIEALRDGPARGIELAPTREWADPTAATRSEIAKVRERWAGAGLPIVACQSLFFGRDDFGIFGDTARRERTAEHLDRMIRLCASLGAGRVTFGAPALRRRGEMPAEEASEIARHFFAHAAATADACGTTLCLEPLPRQYGCDVLVTTRDCVDLLVRVSSPGLALVLDSAALAMNGEPLDEAFRIATPWLRHYHISEPDLAPIGSGGVPHREIAQSLAATGYSGWLTVEMRASEAGHAATVRAAVRRAAEDYQLVTGRCAGNRSAG